MNFLAGLEWPRGDLNKLAGKENGLSKSKTTRIGSSKKTSPRGRDSKMSGDAESIIYPEWMSYLAGFLAKILASLDGRAVYLANARVYSLSSQESLGNFDPDGGSWRTSQVSLMGIMDDGSPQSSQKWPRSGMMRRGIVFRLAPLALLTAETEYGLWQTPESLNQEGYQIANGKRYPRLGAQARMWATPRANKVTGKDREDFSPSLHNQVKMWPTPREFMHKDSHTDRGKGNLGEVVGGNLNPDWVEWLMGLPTGYTNLPRYRASRKSRKTESIDSKLSGMD